MLRLKANIILFHIRDLSISEFWQGGSWKQTPRILRYSWYNYICTKNSNTLGSNAVANKAKIVKLSSINNKNSCWLVIHFVGVQGKTTGIDEMPP